MPYDNSAQASQRIAIIGGGISGLGAAYRLGDSAAVTVFEAAPRLGGHACTMVAGKRGDQPVDIGFIVFNRVNYPNLCQLFADLDAPVAPSNMTFGASIRGGEIEYALRDLNGLFAQRRNLARPAFYRMFRDVLKFNANAHRYVGDDTLTVREMLKDLETGDWFRDYYLLPFSGAIWSTPTQDVMDFPAAAMVRFFQNHHLLDIKGQHQWYTVQGGSIEYVKRLEAALVAQGVDLRLGTGVEAVRRHPGGVQIKTLGAEWEDFDQVIFAAHSDDSMAILTDATEAEKASVGQISYQPNEIILHADPAMMPKRKAAWASWVYTEDAVRRNPRIDLSYWMNSLQPIPHDDPLFVTLNTTRDIRSDLIHHSTTFRHPVYDTGAIAAQSRVHAMNGSNNTWFCGAWLRNGFHEDGLATAFEVADAILAEMAERQAA